MSDIPGSVYDLEMTPITRALSADEPILRISNSAAATDYFYLLELWFSAVGVDGLNEPNALQFVIFNTAGSGGANAPGWKPRNPNAGAAGQIAVQVDNNGWTTQPVVDRKIGAPRPFNLGQGFYWSARGTAPLMLGPFTPTGDIFGFYLTDSVSASMTFHGGATISVP